jgi:hypothetical protein
MLPDFSEKFQSLAASIVALAADKQVITRALRSIRNEGTSTQKSVLEMFQYLLDRLSRSETETGNVKHDTLEILHFGRIRTFRTVNGRSRGFIAPYHKPASTCLLLEVRKEIVRV